MQYKKFVSILKWLIILISHGNKEMPGIKAETEEVSPSDFYPFFPLF